MNNWNKFVYLYTDNHGRLNTATNPMFIARHRSCRAVSRLVLDNADYSSISDFVYAVNNKEKKALEIAHKYGLDEILTK